MAVPLCVLLTLLLHTGKTDSSKYLSYAHRGNERNKDSSVPVIGVVRRQLTVQDIVLSPENTGKYALENDIKINQIMFQ